MATPEEMAASMKANMKEKTGKTLAMWLKVSKASKLDKHGKIVHAVQEIRKLSIRLDWPALAEVSQDTAVDPRHRLAVDRFFHGHAATEVDMIIDDRNRTGRDAIHQVLCDPVPRIGHPVGT